jgi:hypothetical protein
MRPSIKHQSDLFLITEPPEKKVPESERSRVLHLLGDLLWMVFEKQPATPSREEARDE